MRWPGNGVGLLSPLRPVYVFRASLSVWGTLPFAVGKILNPLTTLADYERINF
jgi:hypothetical protein